MTLINDMFSGTGELGRAVAAGLAEPTQILSLSDSYGPARKYPEHRFPGMEVHKDFRDQDQLPGRKEPLMPTKQARSCQVGDILLFKNKESRLITRIEYDPHKKEPYKFHTTDLAGENSRVCTYAAHDRIIYWGTQEGLF